MTMAGQGCAESTKALIDHHHTEYISTYFERSSLRLLKDHSVIFIKGRSGSGKSRLGLRLLSELSKEEGRTPLIITSAKEWKLIPQRRGQLRCKYTIMVDNIFGSSGFVESTVDEWSILFNVIWPSVEAGHIYLILTSRPEISAQCERQLQSNRLMKNITHVTIDDGQYSLRPNEKIRMLKILCQNKTNFTEKEMELVARSGSSIGFPQCCKYYAGSKQAKSKGVEFFLKPRDYILEEIDRLRESDGLGYFVLLLVLLRGGCLQTQDLLTRQGTEEFQETMQIVKEICDNLPSYHSLANIRQKAESFCGTYLDHSVNGFVFQHQSIFDSVFISLSKKYPDICVKTCSVQMLVELVKTKQTEHDSDLAIYLMGEHQEMLADRITDILLTPRLSREIVDHPALKDEVFIQHLIHKWIHEGKTISIFNRRLNNDVKVSFSFPLHEIKQTEIFTVEYLLSYIVLKKLKALTENIFALGLDHFERYILQDCLPCAIFVGNRVLIRSLFDFGLTPNAACFRALCMSRDMDKDISYTVCSFVQRPGTEESQFEDKFTWDSVSNLEDLFKLAVLCGNVFIVEFVVKHLKNQDRRLNFGNCLAHLFKQLSVGYRSCTFQPYNMEHMSNIIRILLNTGCRVHVGYMTLLAATHLSTAALNILTDRGVNVINIHTNIFDALSPVEYYPGALQQAAAYGVDACLLELLELVEGSHQGILNISKTLLFIAIEHGNTGCANILLDRGVPVDVQDGGGNTPLHLAVNYNQLESVKLLTGKNADVNISNYRRCIPMLWVKEQHSPHIDIVQALVRAGSDIEGVDIDNKTILYKAAECGDLAMVKFLLKNGADVNVDVGDVSFTPVMLSQYQVCKRAILAACRYADVDVVKCLHKSGASLDATDFNGETVFHKAARSSTDTIEKLQYLLHVRKDLSQVVDTEGRTAIFEAVLMYMETGDDEPLSFLMERGLSLTDKDGHKRNLLMFVLHNASSDSHHARTLDNLTKMLLGKGIDLNDQDSSGKTVLVYAVENYSGLLNTLLKAGADPNIKDTDGKTVLHYIVEGGCSDNVKLLLNAGSDPCLQDAKGRTALHRACKMGRTDIVKLLLDTPIDLQVQDVEGKTALHYASEINTDILKLLLDAGADPCIQDVHRNSALLNAVATRNYASAKLLLEKGADPCLSNCQGVTPLHRASSHSNGEYLKLLLEHNVNVHVQDKDCWTLLHHAAHRSENVKLLLEKGLSALSKDKFGRTPLHRAANFEAIDSVTLLVEAGADINGRDRQGMTALHHAALHCSDGVVQILVKQLADPNLTDHKGRTPLHFATESTNDSALTILLLEAGCDPNKQDCLGKTPIHYASEKSKNDHIELLLESGANPCVTDELGRTALHYAAAKRESKHLELILHKGADPCVTDKFGKSALHYACHVDGDGRNENNKYADKTRSKSVQLLLKKGSDPGIQDEDGKTALHYLAEKQGTECINMVLDKGADLCKQDKQGKAALHYASKLPNSESVKSFLDAGADLSIRDVHGKTALHDAAEHGSLKTVSLLLKQGADQCAQDEQGMSPLHYAVTRTDCDVAVMKILLDHCSDVNLQSYSSKTALHYAAERGCSASIKLLLQRGASPNEPDGQGRMALHCAALATEGWCTDNVETLLRLGADPSAQDKEGRTALHYAAQSENIRAVKQILKKSDVASVEDQEGKLALHLAEATGNTRIVNLLRALQSD